MSTTAEKLQKIINIKNELKESINAKGGTIDDSTPFSEYAAQVDNLSSGSDYDYTVIFTNYDGTILQTNYVNEGESVVYEGDTPTKSLDDDYMYIFTGWDKDTSNITSDMVVIAEYESAKPTVYTYNLTDASSLTVSVTMKNPNTSNKVKLDWGDGTIEEVPDASSYSHTYSSIGIYKVKILVEGSIAYKSIIPNSSKAFLTSALIQEGCFMDDYQFQNCTNLVKAEIPYGQTGLGDTFMNCTSLKEISIPNTVERISGAFNGCSSLTSVEIPDSVTKLLGSAFYNCTNLESVKLSYNLTEIGNSVFYNCSSLTEIILPETLTLIGTTAFYKCNSLTSITIPDNVVEIKGSALDQCSSLTSIKLSNSLTTIGDYAFRGCSSLTSIIIPNSVTSIGKQAFSTGSSSNKLTITIESETSCTVQILPFGSRSYVQEIRVPMSAVDTYKSATNWSEYADKIVGYVPEDEITITENGTYDVSEKNTAVVNVPTDTSLIKRLLDSRENAISLFEYFNGTSVDDLISYSDTENVTSMINMFYYCRNLTSVPQLDTSKVTDMKKMFYYCSSLTTIPQLNTSNVTNMYYMFLNCTNLTSVPPLDTSKVTNMECMFNGCSSLTTIPQLDTSNVTNMKLIFDGCSSLTTIPQLDTSKVTDMNGMFYGCTSLLTVPPLDTSKVINMTTMFNDCSHLTSVSQLDTSRVTMIGGMFSGCARLNTIDISYYNISSTQDSSMWCSRCNSLTKIIIRSFGDSYILNSNAFNYCYHLTGTVNSAYNPNGDKDCYIYVPDDMVDTLKAATNWSTYASQIKPLSELVE